MTRAFNLAGFLLVMIGLIASPAMAQDEPRRILINYTTVSESPDEQGLGLVFTVLDAAGRAVLNPDIQNVSIVLDNGAPVEVLGTSTPDLPFYIALVLDVSGSMQQAGTAMQSAATAAINNAPQNTQFAVIQFNEQINLLQNFTTDRSAVASAIGQAKSVPNSGTCLYDAIFTGIEQLNTAPDPARRAVIVFTDGRDEITAGRNDQCSEHSFSQVIDLAVGSPQPVPVYTIGLRGDRNINEQELRSFADSTGGLSAIGDQASLTDLFQQIINSLSGQQLVEARLCSASGIRTATLIVDTGQPLEPDVSRFELETACAVATATPLPATPTPTATPRPLQLFIESFSVDTGAGTINFEVRRAGDIPAAQIRVQIADGETGAVQEQQIIQAGERSVDVVQFPMNSTLRGSIEIIASALDANGNVIARQSEEFGITRPTATPTPRPAQVFIESFSVNLDDERMSFEVGQEGDVGITQFRVLVNDRRTGILQVEQLVEVQNNQPHTVEISTADLAGGEITIVVNALDSNGNIVARQTGDFAILRPTPTPTATDVPTTIRIESVEFNSDAKTLTLNMLTGGSSRIEDFRLTIINKTTNLLQGTYSPRLEPRIELPLADLPPGDYIVRASIESASGERVEAESEFQHIVLMTPTPVVAASIRTVDLDGVNNEFIVRIDPENESAIHAYRVRLVNAESGLLVNEFTTFDVPPYDELRFSNTELLAGTYNITVFALDENDRTITSSSVEIDWTPPPPPTPTPEPGVMERASILLRENPPLAIGAVLVVLALLGVMFVLVQGRSRKRESWGTGLPAPDATGVMPVPNRAGVNTATDDDRTQIVMPSATAGVVAASVFVMKAAPGTGMEGQRINLTLPFSIGRSGSTLNFVNDKSVSRNHALITLEGSQFFIQDQGSGNGTLVDGIRLEPNTRVPLKDGSLIKIGIVNELRFEVGDNSTQVFHSQT